MRSFFDLSHPIENGMPYYPGDPVPAVQPAFPEGDAWQVSDLRLGTHTGTHLDAPSHFFRGGRTVDQFPLERFILPGICIRLENLEPDQPIEEDLLARHLVQVPDPGAILISTGWDRFWGQQSYFSHPYLAVSAAKLLAGSGAGLVGIDAPNVDSTVQGSSHAHEILLGREILIVENLRGLDPLAEGEPFQISVLPLRLTGLDGSPVRAVAWKENNRILP